MASRHGHAAPHHASATHAHDEARLRSNRPAQPHATNAYHPSVLLRPAAQRDIRYDQDWRPVSFSQVAPFELAQLVVGSDFRIWENLFGAVQLCEPSGRTRAELPQPRPGPGHGNQFAAYLEDTWRRASLSSVSRTEVVELLMASRIGVHENLAGDLRLIERDGRVRVILRNPHWPPRPSYAA